MAQVPPEEGGPGWWDLSPPLRQPARTKEQAALDVALIALRDIAYWRPLNPHEVADKALTDIEELLR